jgi:hypothetical protein
MVTEVIKTRVSPEIKARVSDAAQRQFLKESVWLRRAVDAALRSESVSEDALIHLPGRIREQVQVMGAQPIDRLVVPPKDTTHESSTEGHPFRS